MEKKLYALVDSKNLIIGTTSDYGDATSRQFWEGFLADPEDYDSAGLATLIDVAEGTDLTGYNLNLDGLTVLSLVF